MLCYSNLPFVRDTDNLGAFLWCFTHPYREQLEQCKQPHSARPFRCTPTHAWMCEKQNAGFKQIGSTHKPVVPRLVLSTHGSVLEKAVSAARRASAVKVWVIKIAAT